jgi:hypothetical protein
MWQVAPLWRSFCIRYTNVEAYLGTRSSSQTFGQVKNNHVYWFLFCKWAIWFHDPVIRNEFSTLRHGKYVSGAGRGSRGPSPPTPSQLSLGYVGGDPFWVSRSVFCIFLSFVVRFLNLCNELFRQYWYRYLGKMSNSAADPNLHSL